MKKTFDLYRFILKQMQYRFAVLVGHLLNFSYCKMRGLWCCQQGVLKSILGGSKGDLNGIDRSIITGTPCDSIGAPGPFRFFPPGVPWTPLIYTLEIEYVKYD